jgi:hypothetical protein
VRRLSYALHSYINDIGYFFDNRQLLAMLVHQLFNLCFVLPPQFNSFIFRTICLDWLVSFTIVLAYLIDVRQPALIFLIILLSLLRWWCLIPNYTGRSAPA